MGLIIKCLSAITLGVAYQAYPKLPTDSLGSWQFSVYSGLNKLIVDKVCPLAEQLNYFKHTECLKFMQSKMGSFGRTKITEGLNQETHFIAGTETLVITPEDWTPEKSNVFFFHGGGHVVGSIFDLETQNVLATIAQKTGARVFSPEYRLAPENKFPTSFDDAYAVVLQVLSDVKLWQIEGDNFALSGSSAGGQIAIAASFRLVMDSMENARVLAPIYPMTGSHLQNFTASQKLYGAHPMLPKTLVTTAYLANLQYNNDIEYLELLDNSNAIDKSWAEEYAHYANKYLPEYYNGYNEIQVSEEKPDWSSYSSKQKKFIRDYQNFMRDYRFGNVKMDNEYLERYLRWGPKHHFYTTAEHDILRDEGLILYHRLKDLSTKGANFELYDAKSLPHGFLKLSSTCGGKISEFNPASEKWLGLLKQKLEN